MRLSKDDGTRIFDSVDAVPSIEEWAKKDNPSKDHWDLKISFFPDRFGDGKDYLKVRNPVGSSIIHKGAVLVKDKNGNLWRLNDFE